MSGLQYLPVPLGVSWRKCHWIRLMPPPPCARLCCTAVTSSCCYSLHSHAEMEKGCWRGKWLRMLHHPQPPPPSDHLKKLEFAAAYSCASFSKANIKVDLRLECYFKQILSPDLCLIGSGLSSELIFLSEVFVIYYCI